MTNRIAVLIDAENISYKYTNAIFKVIGNDGDIVVKKAYGDFSNPCLLPWKDTTLNHAIEAVQRFSYSSGKSSSDSAMNIDAMDMLYSDTADCFVIVSSDSDFTNLAIRLRNDHKKVIGIGEKKASSAFKLACDEYKCIEELCEGTAEQNKTVSVADIAPKAAEKSVPHIPLYVIKKAMGEIIDQNADAEGRVHLGHMGSALKSRYQDFDYKAYGAYRKMNDFVESLAEFELIRDSSYTPEVTYIRKKAANHPAAFAVYQGENSAKEETVQSVNNKTAAYCSVCGEKLAQGAQFCSSCGAQVNRC